MLATYPLFIHNTIITEMNEAQKQETYHYLHLCILSNKRIKENKIKFPGRKQHLFSFISQDYRLS